MTNNKQAIKLSKVKLQKIGNSFYVLIPSSHIDVYGLDKTETVNYDITIKESNGDTE